MHSKNNWDAKSGTENIINVEKYINTETGEMVRPYSAIACAPVYLATAEGWTKQLTFI